MSEPKAGLQRLHLLGSTIPASPWLGQRDMGRAGLWGSWRNRRTSGCALPLEHSFFPVCRRVAQPEGAVRREQQGKVGQRHAGEVDPTSLELKEGPCVLDHGGVSHSRGGCGHLADFDP